LRFGASIEPLADGARLLLPLGEPRAMLLHVVRRREHDVIVGARVREERLQPVVVLLQNRIELVVVAARAAVGHPEEHGANRVGHIVEDLLSPLQQVPRVALVGIVAVERGGDTRVGIARPQLVAGELFADESIVGLVGVERVDHVVAVAPGIGPRFIRLEAFALGVPCQIEPVAAPALAVLRRGQQPVDNVGERVGRPVGKEGSDRLGRRRQSDQIEIAAAQ
jgi:hypothetical protein